MYKWVNELLGRGVPSTHTYRGPGGLLFGVPLSPGFGKLPHMGAVSGQ